MTRRSVLAGLSAISLFAGLVGSAQAEDALTPPTHPTVIATTVDGFDEVYTFSFSALNSPVPIVGYECAIDVAGLTNHHAPMTIEVRGTFAPCVSPVTYSWKAELKGEAGLGVEHQRVFRVRAISDQGVRSVDRFDEGDCLGGPNGCSAGGTAFVVGRDPVILGGRWERRSDGCWWQTVGGSEPLDIFMVPYCRGGVAPTTTPTWNESAITLTSVVKFGRAGTLAQTAKVRGVKAASCSVRRTVKTAGRATLSCKLGRNARLALKKRAITVDVETRATPRVGSPLSGSRTIAIPRKR